MTLTQIAALTGAALHGPRTDRSTDRVVTAVVRDPDAVTAGSVFAPLVPGATSTDLVRAVRHAFGALAARRAVGVIAAQPVPGVRTVVVDDVEAALETLAAHAALAFGRRVMVDGGPDSLPAAQILAQLLPDAVAAIEIPPRPGPNAVTGALLTCGPDVRQVVADLGAAGSDAAARAIRVLRPQVLTVLPASAECPDGVLRAPQAVFDLAPACAVLPAGYELHPALEAWAPQRVVTYSADEDVPAAVRAEDLMVLPDGRARFTLVHGAVSRVVELALHSPEHVEPALAAAATALAAGQRFEDVVSRLGRARLPSGCLTTREYGDARLLFADGCGTGAAATEAALRVLHRRGLAQHRPAAALLGELRGTRPGGAIQQIRRTATDLGVEVAVIGSELAGGMSPQSRGFPTASQGLAWVRARIASSSENRSSIVLIKGSTEQCLTADAVTADLQLKADGPDTSPAGTPSHEDMRYRNPEVAAAQVLAEACRRSGRDAARARRLPGEDPSWRLDGAVVARVHLDRPVEAAARALRGTQWLARRGIPVVAPAHFTPIATGADSCATLWQDTGHWTAPLIAAGTLLAAVHSIPADGLHPSSPLLHLEYLLARVPRVDPDRRALVAEHLGDLSERYARLTWPTPRTTILGDSKAPNLRRDRAGHVRLAAAGWPLDGHRQWDLAVIRREVDHGRLHPADHQLFLQTYERSSALNGLADWPGYGLLIDLIDLTEALGPLVRRGPGPARAGAETLLTDLVDRQRAAMAAGPCASAPGGPR
ncbi:hypothetical protein [Kitasatospora sp. NPDC088779]|uniref:hypothetical protein n=1 Tax=Kitasatospora sp. NPDC088779 TaxID=3154964 RepID=UPI003426BB58